MPRRASIITTLSLIATFAMTGSSAVAFTTNGPGGFGLAVPATTVKTTSNNGVVKTVNCAAAVWDGWLHKLGTPEARITPKLTGCTIPKAMGAPDAATVTCSPGALTITGVAGGTASGNWGTVCTIIVPAANCGTAANPATGVQVVALAPSAYDNNPNPKTFAIGKVGQSATATWPAGNCTTYFGQQPASALIYDTVAGTDLVSTVNSPFVPSIT